jgi:hypothetical protein
MHGTGALCCGPRALLKKKTGTENLTSALLQGETRTASDDDDEAGLLRFGAIRVTGCVWEKIAQNVSQSMFFVRMNT